MSGSSTILAFFGALALLGLAASDASFQTVASGSQSGIHEPRQVVVRTQPEWEQLWKRHAAGQPIPKLDFDQVMAIGVFVGTRPTSGYAVQIKGVRREQDVLVVEYTERTPSPGAMTMQVLTFPFQLVSVTKQPGEVRFEPVGAPQLVR